MIDQKIYNQIIELLQTTEKDNPDLINYVISHKDSLNGPVQIKTEQIQRTLGPEQHMLNHESGKDFQLKVNNIVQRIKENPAHQIYLICEKYDDVYYILDGNHSFEAMKINGQGSFLTIFTNDSIIYSQLNP